METVPVRPGDGVVIDTGADTDREQGGRVFTRRPRCRTENCGSPSSTAKSISAACRPATASGKRTIRNSIASCAKAGPATCQNRSGRWTRPFQVARARRCRSKPAAEKRTATVDFCHAVAGRTKSVRSPRKRCAANSVASAKRLSFLDRWTNRLEGDVILPMSELNRLRRELVEKLEKETVREVRHPELTADRRSEGSVQSVSDPFRSPGKKNAPRLRSSKLPR